MSQLLENAFKSGAVSVKLCGLSFVWYLLYEMPDKDGFLMKYYEKLLHLVFHKIIFAFSM